MTLKHLSLLAVAVLFSLPAFAQRQTLDLSGEWKFLKQDTASNAKTDHWHTVTVPHTWNAEDGADGKDAEPLYPEGYYRGPCWYERTLNVPADWKGKRVFIWFGGASIAADVLVNAVPVGQHRGAFAAFCFEIGQYLNFDGKDSVRVRVNNARDYGVPPLSGDFTVFGGLYRPVQLIATDEVCVSPLDFGSPGVFLTVKGVNRQKASVEARVVVSTGTIYPPPAREPGKEPNSDPQAWVDTPAPVTVHVEIKDAAGKVVAQASHDVTILPGSESTVAQQMSIPNPHLWNGRPDPYLYSATVSLSRGGKKVDEVTQPLGIRTVAITNDKGFLLNGKPYPMHGVDYHQDRAGKGWAVSDADQDEDHAMIEELGATCVRLAHYQQSPHFHDLSDRSGLIEWQEVPLVDSVAGTPQFLANARQQLAEMILQGYNHPALCMWGLFNELDAGWAATHSAPTAPVVQELQALAKQLDSTRPTVGASWPQDPGPRHRIPDWCCWNIYPGWYAGKADDAAGMIAKYSGELGKRIGISEYGAGANPAQFQEGELTHPDPGGAFHPQEWQDYVHERLWAQMKDNPHIWGTFIWVMFDFASDGRNEGSTPGINDKGLVTRDRKTRKDTFYFYKANWNPAPLVYIASRGATPRKQAVTDIKVYSNCQQVELKVNGKSIGVMKPDDIHVCLWPKVQLQPGANRIEADGGNGSVDACDWTLE